MHRKVWAEVGKRRVGFYKVLRVSGVDVTCILRTATLDMTSSMSWLCFGMVHSVLQRLTLTHSLHEAEGIELRLVTTLSSIAVSLVALSLITRLHNYVIFVGQPYLQQVDDTAPERKTV